MKNRERWTGEDHKMGYSQHCGFTSNSGYTYVKRRQTYEHDIEECLRNNVAVLKQVLHILRVSLALVIQHAEYMSSVACLGVPCFFHILSYMARFLEKKGGTENKMCVLISLQLLSEIFLILRRIQQDIIINVHRSSCKLPIILVRFLIKSEFSCQIF
jgi:hypothetical protein